ncbi:MAG: arginine N-succinyltransferase [Chlamydiae bacterium]|nr:arginine N-succinyltransferase [Chlamydiota bacterium]MBI3276690.1 arginine N-succinyltransferase [Chlamydiota bacterium]
MFVIRSIRSNDLPSFFRLAAMLNTYNLPKDRLLLAKMIQVSNRSFKGKLSFLHEGRYVLVAEEISSGKIVGTSEILAKKGFPKNPFIFCEVGEDCMESKTLHKKVSHRYIKLHSTSDGATEIGGLVVDPHYRGHGCGIGKVLSYVRMMYIKAHPGRFQKRILAELLAYLDPEGENPLWNVLGKHFTGLSYARADRLSIRNKEFILSLFPSEKIYTCLLPERVQKVLEEPGFHTIPAKVLLEKIGFKYLHQIDPFDGGPLYGAKTHEIRVCRETKEYRFLDALKGSGLMEGIVMVEKKGEICASLATANLLKTGMMLEERVAKFLQLRQGEKIWFYKI